MSLVLCVCQAVQRSASHPDPTAPSSLCPASHRGK